MVRYHITFEGRVQGVGFRYFCQLNATNLNLTGYAHNMDNGMVEVQIQGDEDYIDKFIAIVKKGNRFIRVDNFSLKRLSPLEYERRFKIQ